MSNLKLCLTSCFLKAQGLKVISGSDVFPFSTNVHTLILEMSSTSGSTGEYCSLKFSLFQIVSDSWRFCGLCLPVSTCHEFSRQRCTFRDQMLCSFLPRDLSWPGIRTWVTCSLYFALTAWGTFPLACFHHLKPQVLEFMP